MSSQDLVRKRKRTRDRQHGDKKLFKEALLPEHSPPKRRYTKNDKRNKVKHLNRTPVEGSDVDFVAEIESEQDGSEVGYQKKSQGNKTDVGVKTVGDSDNESPDEGHQTRHETEEPAELKTEQDDEQELKAVKEELSQMSFEELQQLKEKLGTKTFNQVMHGQKKKVRPRTSEGQNVDFKRANKKRPMEISSKKTVARYRQIIPVKKKVFRDPRFDDLSGEYKEDIFQQLYSFLDNVKERERLKLQNQLKKEKDPETRMKIMSVLNRMTQQRRTEQDKAKRLEQEKGWTRKEKDLVSQGKKPFFLKKSDKRKLELAEKYRELQKSGKLEKYLSKKRKKTSQKQRRKLIDL